MENAEKLTNAKIITDDCNVDKAIQEQVCDAINNIGYSKRLKGHSPTTLEGKIVSKEESKNRHQIVVDFLYHLFNEENAPEWIEYLNNYLK